MNKIIVNRDLSTPQAPGTAEFYFDDEKLASCNVITGGSELDPKSYGGPTPPGIYALIKRVEQRETEHYSQVCSILFPCFDMEYKYPSRTFWKLELDPFRWHYASKNGGRSTGCICPQDQEDFQEMNGLINQAIDANEIVYVEVL